MRLIIAFLFFLLPFQTSCYAADYQSILFCAQREKKPVVLAFLGDEQCACSQELVRSIFSTKAFLEGKEYLFLQVCLPADSELATNEALALKERFSIEETPTVLLVDLEGNLIAPLDVTDRSAELLATTIKENYLAYLKIQEVVRAEKICPEEQLKEVYTLAKKLNNSALQDQLIQLGLASSRDSFFLMEKYLALVKEAKDNNAQLKFLRKQIARRADAPQCQFTLALADFQAKAAEVGYKKKEDPFETIAPLITYLKKFGRSDRENSWRAEKEISEFLFTRQKFSQALDYARSARETAPEEVRKELAVEIAYMEKIMASPFIP